MRAMVASGMRLGSLIALIPALSLGCGGGQAAVGTSVGSPEPRDDEADAAAAQAGSAGSGGSVASAGAAGVGGAAGSAGGPSSAYAPEPLPPDPALVRALVAKTGEAGGPDNPLHVRMEILPRPAGELWLLAVVNRGTEAARVRLDPNKLSLSLAEPEPEKPRPKWQKKPAPVLCKLPAAFGGNATREIEESLLEPGEGLVQTFDPRLYCISSQGESLLVLGKTLTPRLGFTPKPPKVVWKQGRRTEQPVLQQEPFVAVPSEAAEAAELDPLSDRRVKELVGGAFVLDAEMLGVTPEPDTTQPLELRLVRGSDADTERTATALVQVRSTGKPAKVYFRRELVSFEVHGPEGIRGCDPQPDDRAPDRQAYSSLAAGGSISATCLLAELCPTLTFGRPGLYLLSARFNANRDGAAFGFAAFTGQLEGRHQALVRIRTGDLPALPPPEPIRVKVGE